jgi:hypothetical protein
MKSGYKNGGSTGKIGSYAKSNPKVLAEAHDKSEGAVLSAQASKSPMATAATSGAGAVGGKKSMMRLDRPGRKMGGRVGADCSPLSSAAKTSG